MKKTSLSGNAHYFCWVNYTIHPSSFQRIWVCFILFNETWKFVDWQNELDPLQVYSARFLRSHGNRHCGRSLRLGYRKRYSMFFRLLYPLWFSDASGRCSPENFKSRISLCSFYILFSVRWNSSYFVVYNPKEHYCSFGLFLFSALIIALS